jgi:hypothetical protein
MAGAYHEMRLILILTRTGPPAAFYTDPVDMRSLFAFPDPVNEVAARVVAAGVVLLAAVTLATGWMWLLVALAYGFWARLLTGPTLSPWGWAAQNLIAPRLAARRPVPGPPKRFAQAIGAAMTSAALALGLGLGDHLAADVLLGAIIVAAGLESGLGVCLGCRAFALLIRAGIVPQSVCAECADIRGRLAAARAASDG